MVNAAQTGMIANTLSERGMAVPFTTPDLTQCRVRLDSGDRFEFLLPNFSGAKGRYVMPWRSVTAMMTTTLHDRALYEKMCEQRTHDPIKLRSAALEVAATGLAGPKAAQSAADALEADRQYQIMTNFLLVLELLKLVGLSPVDLIADGLASDAAQERIKAALRRVADRFRISHDDLYMRVEVLSGLVAAVGLPGAPEKGRLRLLVGSLTVYRDTMRQWAMTLPAELAELTEFQALVSDRTHQLAHHRIEVLDQKLAAVGSVVANWEGRVPALSREIREIAFLLDGWDYLIALCQEAAEKDAGERQNLITEGFQMLPVIPRDQMLIADEKRMSGLKAIQRRWVRANEDWRAGVFDYDQVMKTEAIKARVA
ncbi:MAG: hypothetical protein GC191_10750 [Azospirillum sp.]|nr:hypothetical protein [Azospirillum sp.]